MPPPNVEGVEYYDIPDFSFSNGSTLHDVRVAYRSYNASSTAGVVLIPTCYAGFINTTLSFTSAPYDALAPYHVVVVAMLGNGESSSPSNKKFFPLPGELRYQDVIHAQHQLLTTHLKVSELEAVVGFSMGGQQAYHWAAMYPDFVKRSVAICSSARTSLHNYAFLEGPIAGLINSIDYIAWQAMKDKLARGEDVGAKLKELTPKHGLRAFARGYAAWLTSTGWFRNREFKNAGMLSSETIEEWMKKREEGYMAWDADDLLVLARMWQMGDIGLVIPGQSEVKLSQLGGDVPDDDLYVKALGSIKAKMLVMPCRTDQYFPPEDSEIEMKHLKHGTLAVIESTWGHTAGGGANPKDIEFMNSRIAEFIKA